MKKRMNLSCLLLVFSRFLRKSSIWMSAQRKVKIQVAKAKSLQDGQISGEVIAAISMALYEISNDAHDIENTVLTMVGTRRPYSPWSSKIYGLRQIPHRK